MSEPATKEYNPRKYLQPFEQAARIYCAKTGLDPDLVLPRPHPTIGGILEPWPQWQVVAEDLLDLSMKLTAMREASVKPVIATPAPH